MTTSQTARGGSVGHGGATAVPQAAAGRGATTPWLGQGWMAAWYLVFAGYAGIVAIFCSASYERAWGTWAVAPYALAGLLALRWRSHGRTASLLVSAAGALVAPVIWLSGAAAPTPDVKVVSRAGLLLLRHGSPYLDAAQIAHVPGAIAYNPYLPAMTLFGLPRALHAPGVLGDPRVWLTLATFVLLALSFRVAGRSDVLRCTLFAVGTPVVAFPLALGITDPPMLAVICLALALLARPVLSRALAGSRRTARTGPAGARPAGQGSAGTWPAGVAPGQAGNGVPLARQAGNGLRPARQAGNGLRPARQGGNGLRPARQAGRSSPWRSLWPAAIAVGVACAMKYTAWPALPVIAAMLAARDGFREAARFTAGVLGTALVLSLAFAPAVLARPAQLVPNTVLFPLGMTKARTPAASPLPGHLIATSGHLGGHPMAIFLLITGCLAVLASLVIRPPADSPAAARRLALLLTLIFALDPATRFGYFAYPAGLFGWLALCQGARPAGQPAWLPAAARAALARRPAAARAVLARRPAAATRRQPQDDR